MVHKYYEVIMEEDAKLFKERVNDFISKGWKPQGGLIYIDSGNGTFFGQSLYKSK